MTTHPDRIAMTLAILAAWAGVTLAQATAADVPSGPSPSIATVVPAASGPLPDGPTIWLRGPFGRVVGGTLDDPATAAPLGAPLDTFVRRAPLVLETEDEALPTGIEVVARSLDSPEQIEMLSRGTLDFEGPAQVGRHVVVAALGGDAGSRRAWLIEVPDRDPPEDGLYDIPAPEILVSTSGGTRHGILGDGCYIYLCVETGRPTPPDQLVPLPALVAETPELRIGDGSALVAWEGRLTPLGGTSGEERHASGAVMDTPVSALALSGLDAPARGEWLLEVEVELDRERGWLRTAYRLVVERAGDYAPADSLRPSLAAG